MKAYRSKQTGLFVGRQADQVEGEDYETIEIPINPKEETLSFLNNLLVQSQVSAEIMVDVNPPKLSPTDETHLKVREDILKGNLDLEQTLWNAPLDLCIRLGTIVLERTREHFAKLEKSHG